MAEFALGLTKTAVAGTVSSVKSAFEEESTLRGRVQEDLVFITGEFEMMQSFLSTSNAGERASMNLVVRTWVRQLRDLAFDVEDCVEFIVHLDNTSTWSWLWRVVPSCMAPLRSLDQAVAEVTHLKARVEDVSRRNTRYNLIGGGGGGGEGSGSAADGSHSQLPASTASSKGPSGALHVLLDAWKALGKFRYHTTMGLEKLIASQVTQLQVISLWRATADVEADPLPAHANNMMKKAYDHPEIRGRFKNRAWVKLSDLLPFNPMEFLNHLLTQFTSCHHHANANSTISELLLQLSRITYLIVIDQEFTTVVDWEAIRLFLPDGNNGSRILLSTNSLSIALICTGEPYQVSEFLHFSPDGGLYAIYPKGSEIIREDNTEDMDAYELGYLVGRKRESSILKQGWDYDNKYKTTSVWGIAGVGKSAFVREQYRRSKTQSNAMHAWVDVAHPFNLTDFCRDLLLDFYSDDVEKKEAAAIAMVEGQDPTQWCSTIMRTKRVFLVVDGLQSKHDWDLIKAALLSGPVTGHTVVITREESIANYCMIKGAKCSVRNLKGLKDGPALDLGTKIQLVT